MINPGQLHEVITFEQSANTADGAGGFTAAWSTLAANVRAAIMVKEVKHLTEEGKEYHQTVFKIMVRYNEVALTDIGQVRIVWGSDTLKILTIKNKRSAARDRVWKIEAADIDGVISN